MRLRPKVVPCGRGLVLLKIIRRSGGWEWPMDIGNVGRFSTSGLIDDINREAFAEEVLRPSRPAIGCLKVNRSRSSTAMDEHNRVRAGPFGRNEILGADLPAHDFLAFDF